VYEILEVSVDILSHYQFYTNPRVVRKLVCMTKKTAAVVTLRTIVPNRPVLAIDAAEHASSICNGRTAAVDTRLFLLVMLTDLRAVAKLTLALAPHMLANFRSIAKLTNGLLPTMGTLLPNKAALFTKVFYPTMCADIRSTTLFTRVFLCSAMRTLLPFPTLLSHLWHVCSVHALYRVVSKHKHSLPRGCWLVLCVL
jgi:hypothetical protein